MVGAKEDFMGFQAQIYAIKDMTILSWYGLASNLHWWEIPTCHMGWTSFDPWKYILHVFSALVPWDGLILSRYIILVKYI